MFDLWTYIELVSEFYFLIMFYCLICAFWDSSLKSVTSLFNSLMSESLIKRVSLLMCCSENVMEGGAASRTDRIPFNWCLAVEVWSSEPIYRFIVGPRISNLDEVKLSWSASIIIARPWRALNRSSPSNFKLLLVVSILLSLSSFINRIFFLNVLMIMYSYCFI